VVLCGHSVGGCGKNMSRAAQAFQLPQAKQGWSFNSLDSMRVARPVHLPAWPAGAVVLGCASGCLAHTRQAPPATPAAMPVLLFFSSDPPLFLLCRSFAVSHGPVQAGVHILIAQMAPAGLRGRAACCTSYWQRLTPPPATLSTHVPQPVDVPEPLHPLLACKAPGAPFAHFCTCFPCAHSLPARPPFAPAWCPLNLVPCSPAPLLLPAAALPCLACFC